MRDLLQEKDRTREAVSQIVSWCLVIALHQTEGIGKKRQDDVIFLRKLVSGGADQSYGIEVAQLAGVPAWIIRRGREILKELEAGERPAPVQPKEEPEEQVGLADLAGQAVLEELRKVELNTLTPIEAMNLLYGWKAKLEG